MHITKLLQTYEETNNPVYMLTMDKQQWVLVNMLISSIFEH